MQRTGSGQDMGVGWCRNPLSRKEAAALPALHQLRSAPLHATPLGGAAAWPEVLTRGCCVSRAGCSVQASVDRKRVIKRSSASP